MLNSTRRHSPRLLIAAAAPALPRDAPASQPLAPAASDVPASAPSDCSDLAAVANTDTGVADDGADGPPSEDVIRQTIQAQFMVDYVKPITCLRPAVEIGRIQVGAPIDKVIHLFDSDTTSAYPVKSVVKINIFSGDTYLRSYQRGVNGEIF